MPLEPYQYRPTTPPSAEVPGLIHSTHSRNLSGSSFWSYDSSPDSIDTHVTTPSHSPIRQNGPTLLPKIRTQDQSIMPTIGVIKPHRRALSSTNNPPAHPRPARPHVQRSTTSPPECISLISPTSTTSSSGFSKTSTVNSPITLTPAYSRRLSGHGRSVSTSSVNDISTLGKYSYPTYRRLPVYTCRSAQYSPSVIPGSSTFVSPAPRSRSQPRPIEIARELQYDSPDERQSSLREYLTGSNPPVNLVRQVNTVLGRGLHSHFWWDIRNLRVWEDFTLEAMEEVPGLTCLLDQPVAAKAFPVPIVPQSRLQPDSEVALHEIYRDFYATKVTAALKTSLGHISHISMRGEKARDGPHFVSNYQDDFEKTFTGNGRGRVVGLVRSFDRWNTGMRHEAPHRRVVYLEGLSHLHRYMREHSCRYGFIMTEIELVCVRAGANDIPYFGFLELANTVEMKTQRGLTACLALWYLHMLAKEEPLPGQPGWRLEVGAPTAMTRMHVMPEKDDWIRDPQVGEKRDAKRVRGWVMPGDPFNRRRELRK
ncbi:hypothetical protein MMC20_002251 [Loxospora ochrophaea]|nr:hypothetical protein [Loxospora ochrophaea]